METLNFDTMHTIFSLLSMTDKLNFHRLFDETPPTQFQVSSELLKSKQIKGNKGLVMRAQTTGEKDPFVFAMLYINSRIFMSDDYSLQHYKTYLSSELVTPEQRIARLEALITVSDWKQF
jgi:hypothetical protein